MEKKTAKVDNRYYRLDWIKEAVDIVIGDDGFRGKEVIEILEAEDKRLKNQIQRRVS